MLPIEPGALAFPLYAQDYSVQRHPSGLGWEWLASWASVFGHLDLLLYVPAGSTSVREQWSGGFRAEVQRPRFVESAWPSGGLETVVGEATGLDVLSVTLLVAHWETQVAALVEAAKALGLAWQGDPAWTGEAEAALTARWHGWGGFTW